jgi:hypothetical protein
MPRLTVWPLLALLTLACDGSERAGPFTTAMNEPPGAYIGRERTQRSPAMLTQEVLSRVGEARADSQLIVRSASLHIQVESVDAAVARADTAIRRHEGLISDSRRITAGADKLRASMVIRVPSSRLQDLLRDLKPVGTVKGETLTQEDVTRQYTDLEMQLAVKRQTVVRLRQLLSSSTGRLADVLQVERELERVVIEVERLEGERRYHADRVAMSTLSLELFEPGALSAPPSQSVGEALRRSLEVLSISLAWMVYLVTFVAPWVAIASGAWWLTRRFRAKRLSPPA